MNNYQYIITGLPVLVADFSAGQFSYSGLAESIKEQLSAKDRQTVRWLEFGMDTSRLSGHFYRAAARHKSPFIRQYFAMDRKIRNAQAIYIAEKEGLDSHKYTIGETESSKEDYPELQQIFQNTDLFEREHLLDKFKWDRITEMTVFHYFDIEVILGFLAKGMIVERWSALDKEKGAALFSQYVNEVRGTFKGIDFK